MARLQKRDLIAQAADALKAGGWNVLYLTPPTVHPARFRLFRDGVVETVRVYIWNVSHGGGKVRPKDEFRIQITGVTHLTPETGGKTLLLGWDDNLGVFAAYDIAKHKGAVATSPSIQIGRTALENAAQNGLAPYNRGNGEVAYAVRPDFLSIYVAQVQALHESGSASAEVALLEKLTADPDTVDDDEVENIVSGPRKRALLMTWRLLRDRKFSKKVLNAYHHGCAMCGVQLGLLDAAHILPVGHPDSTDRTRNGVALCALHHRAYDHSLVTFDETFDILVSVEGVAKLTASKRAGGEKGFRDALQAKLTLPTVPGHRPRAANVRKANQLRGWL
ncbi:putative restriction endonuclease [Sphingomonas sp. SORGH_AS870]|uniref:HNH endonuclease n=1 Tax=Sphingomonas sp. SORGH_AS_0870 TaxID=3041801 RepID=UPI0028619A57|nr:HNH endonuclease [Sphingomonas sp. SORGH_AS_0870]MDR6144345.1 putative restriction endonuclease [Sphingomonas sp. SORGH_AS_0870]